jgi:hypothetical protein
MLARSLLSEVNIRFAYPHQAYVGANAFSGSGIGPSPFQYGDSLRSWAMIGGIAAIT